MKRVLILAVLLAACLGCAATAFAQQIGSYPYATTPLLGTEQMVGNQAAKYPCVGCTVTITPAMLAAYTVGLAPAYGLVYNNNGAPAGIIPSAAGQYCLDWPSTTSAPTLVTCSSTVYPGAGIPDSTGTAWGTSYATTGSGDVVLSTSPTLVTPALGTPSAIVLTNGTGLPYSALTSGTNTAAAMVVGSGASLTTSGSGSISANEVNGGAVPTSAQCLSTNNTGQPVAGCPEPVEAPITASTYTLALSDCGQQIPLENSTGVTVTVPGGASFDGCQIDLTVPVGFGTSTVTGSVAAPTNGALTETSPPSTLAATTYYVQSTWVTAVGETVGSTATSLAVAADDVLNVAAPSNPPPTADGWNVYVCQNAGASCTNETLQNTSPLGITAAWVEPTVGLTTTGAATPTTNTAGVTLGGNSTITMAANSQAGINFDGTNWQLLGCTACVSGGVTVNLQVFTTVGTNTWTKPSTGTVTTAECVGGGGGGGGGQVEPSGTAAYGGAGGGGGGFAEESFETASLAATETVTIGAGGAGATDTTSTGSGLFGANGTASSFGTLLTAYGGGGGEGSSGTNAYGGGGAGLAGNGSSNSNGLICGAAGGDGAGQSPSCSGGGAAGGGTDSSFLSSNGGSSALGGSGGGSGGSLAATPADVSGGNSGTVLNSAAVSGGPSGANGAAGQIAAGVFAAGTGGGGGGSSTTGNSGSGGAGAVGGGGGGGGAALNGVGASGAGGAGGSGECVVITQ